MDMYVKMMDSPLGKIKIESDGEGITRLSFSEELVKESACPVLEDACERLKRYFSKECVDFSSVPLKPAGTEFEAAVWNQILRIPVGETRTYKQIAALLDKESACRAVGRACAKNPIWILIPCHRVVGSKGLTGYAGGLYRKEQLLKLEGAYFSTNSSAI